MAVELKVPSMGESITEVHINSWLKEPGEAVATDEPIVEFESDKATMEFPSPSSGRLTKVLKQAGEYANVGDVIGYLEEGEAPEAEAKPRKEKKAEAPKAKKAETGAKAKAEPEAEEQAKEHREQPEEKATKGKQNKGGGEDGSETRVMPAARILLEENDLSAEDVAATGPGGRLLKEDVLAHLDEHFETGAPAAAPAPQRAEPAHGTGDRGSEAPAEGERVVPMTPMRRTIAGRLVQAQQTAALLTTFNEVDMSAVMALREKYKQSYMDRHGVKLGFMSFFVKAVIEGLRGCPELNAEIRGDNLVYRDSYNIGIAVSAKKGLVVPVLRGAERMGFAEIEKTINDLGVRARDGAIDLGELRGGTFTISNGGIFGSMLSTPIVNPPQSGILGMHAITQRPMAVDGQVVIRPMMYLALTYDHRIVDGREAVGFLVRVKECLEDPARLMLEI